MVKFDSLSILLLFIVFVLSIITATLVFPTIGEQKYPVAVSFLLVMVPGICFILGIRILTDRNLWD